MNTDFNSDWLTGNNEIDNQHKELLDQLNSLYLDSLKGRDKDIIAKKFIYVEEYLNVHLYTEDHYMKEYNYPKVAIHIDVHEEVRKNIKSLQEDLKNEESVVNFSFKVKERMIDLYVNHIGTFDKELGEFLSSNNIV